MESIWSSSRRNISINEIGLYLRTDHLTNVLGEDILTNQSTTAIGFPATNAVDRNTSTFSLTDNSATNLWWAIYIGPLSLGDIDRIEVNNRLGDSTLIGANIRLRNTTVDGYVPNVTNVLDVLWSTTINVASLSQDVPHSYRPVDIDYLRWTTQQKIVVTGASSFTLLGFSSCLNNNASIIAVGEHSANSGTGGIRIYRFNSTHWVDVQSLIAPVGLNRGNTGKSISVWSGVIAAGAPADSLGAGKGVIYEYDGVSRWTQSNTLTGTGAVGTASLGESISIYENTVAIGGPTDGASVGAIWVFTKTSYGIWSQQGSKLVGSDASGASKQGTSVAIWEDTVASGGFADSGNIGAVWVFTRTGGVWSQQGGKLVPSGGVSNSYFGLSVSIQRDILAVGSPRDNNLAGSAYVFTRSGGVWTQRARLVGSNPLSGQLHGSSISIWNDYIGVGAPGSAIVGSAYIYKLIGSDWREARHLFGLNTIGNSGQGASISVRNSTVVVGGSRDSSNKGALWIYRE